MSDPQRVPMRRWLRVLLFASLAVNLLVVGLVAGLVLSGPPDRRSAGPSDVMAPYVRALGREGRQATFGTLRARIAAQAPSNRDARGAQYREASRLLRAEALDRAAFETLLADQGARSATRQRIGQAVLTEYLVGLDAEARRAFADRLDAEVSKRRSRETRTSKE